jgi:hypothetical protein
VSHEIQWQQDELRKSQEAIQGKDFQTKQREAFEALKLKRAVREANRTAQELNRAKAENQLELLEQVLNGRDPLTMSDEFLSTKGLLFFCPAAIWQWTEKEREEQTQQAIYQFALWLSDQYPLNDKLTIKELTILATYVERNKLNFTLVEVLVWSFERLRDLGIIRFVKPQEAAPKSVETLYRQNEITGKIEKSEDGGQSWIS